LVGAAFAGEFTGHGGRLRAYDLPKQLVHGDGRHGNQGHHDNVFRQNIKKLS
jgi:hypothetical protein